MRNYLHAKMRAMKKRLRGAYLHKLFGDRLFHSHIWAHDRRAISGGLALGLFIAFTPTIPLQMLLVACGAFYFRVNIGIALAACWVTNPLTMAPVYHTAWKLGRWVLEEVAVIEGIFDMFSQGSRAGTFLRHSGYLWTGSIIMATAAALAGYIGGQLAWLFFAKTLKSVPARRRKK